MNIAYVCYTSGTNFQAIEEENELLLQYLQAKGLAIKKEIWDDPAVDWRKYDLVVLKAPWDYFDKYPQFLNWLDLLEEQQVRMLNPVSTVRWNSDKLYLKEIAEAGLEVISSSFIEQGEKVELEQYFDVFRTDSLIVKPTVSGGAKNTFSVKTENVKEVNQQLQMLLQEESFIVQPFVKEIQDEGEWSFVFFNGVFSHALLKKAKAGDFRVQHIHGGSVHTMEAPGHMLEKAQQYIDTFAKGCLYARVDGVLIEGKFALMELELIEPYLYLFTSEAGAENYYQALRQLL